MDDMTEEEFQVHWLETMRKGADGVFNVWICKRCGEPRLAHESQTAGDCSCGCEVWLHEPDFTATRKNIGDAWAPPEITVAEERTSWFMYMMIHSMAKPKEGTFIQRAPHLDTFMISEDKWVTE